MEDVMFSKKVTVSVTEDVWRSVPILSRKLGVKKSQMIRRAIDEFLQRQALLLEGEEV